MHVFGFTAPIQTFWELQFNGCSESQLVIRKKKQL